MSKSLKNMLSESNKQGLWPVFLQLVKFGFVGVSNTAILYGIEMLCYYVLLIRYPLDESLKVVLTTALAFIVSVTNSYIWNNKFVFKAGQKNWKEHLKAYLKTVACYGITGLVLSPILKVIFGNWGVPYWAASLSSMIITVPLNFVMNKLWTFRNKN